MGPSGTRGRTTQLGGVAVVAAAAVLRAAAWVATTVGSFGRAMAVAASALRPGVPVT